MLPGPQFDRLSIETTELAVVINTRRGRDQPHARNSSIKKVVVIEVDDGDYKDATQDTPKSALKMLDRPSHHNDSNSLKKKLTLQPWCTTGERNRDKISSPDAPLDRGAFFFIDNFSFLCYNSTREKGL